MRVAACLSPETSIKWHRNRQFQKAQEISDHQKWPAAIIFSTPSAVSSALGVGNGKAIANASDLVNGASGAVSIGSDVLNGNVDGLDTTLDVLSTVASVDATRKRGSDNDISVFNDVKIKHSDKRSTLYKTAAKAKSLHKEFKQNNGTSIF